MAWLQVHQTLKDHRKLFDAADELEITTPHMMGLLVSFWLWALDNAPKGDLAGITPRMIARAAQWDGEPEKLAETLIRAGWIDENEDGTLEIHDWYEYAGKLIDQRQAEKERSARRRAAAASPSDDTPDDQTPTAGQPPDATPTTGGKSRVDQSREKKGRVTPPTPSDEGDGAGQAPAIRTPAATSPTTRTAPATSPRWTTMGTCHSERPPGDRRPTENEPKTRDRIEGGDDSGMASSAPNTQRPPQAL